MRREYVVARPEGRKARWVGDNRRRVGDRRTDEEGEYARGGGGGGEPGHSYVVVAHRLGDREVLDAAGASEGALRRHQRAFCPVGVLAVDVEVVVVGALVGVELDPARLRAPVARGEAGGGGQNPPGGRPVRGCGR